MMYKILLLLCAWASSKVAADLPVNCTFDDIRGSWIFYETERKFSPNIDCQKKMAGNWVQKTQISLEYPNIATDQYGNEGTWTMIFNQGFEVRVSGRSYFAFSNFTKNSETVISFCDSTMNGWSRDATIRNWSCFKGRKTVKTPPKHYRTSPEKNFLPFGESRKRTRVMDSTYRVRPAKPSYLTRLRSKYLPDTFDWRNVSGVNYVSPVRRQSCGSCYAFISMASLESRIRIMTNNEQQPIFSPQDILECSPYSQGCKGGYVYLIAGRYAQDFGVVEESCSKYNPYDEPKKFCSTDRACKRHFVEDYRYVGGYFGGCNEEEMRLALINNGPLMVAFETYDDFHNYEGGIYKHTKTGGFKDERNPLGEINHGGLVVGYGEDSITKEKYWVVKNSWGAYWGENGYFRIRRGTDECGIESMASEAIPIPA